MPKPGGCKLCARFAPEKCKHHGGPSHSTSRRGNRAKAAGEGKRKPHAKPAPRPTKAIAVRDRTAAIAPVTDDHIKVVARGMLVELLEEQRVETEAELRVIGRLITRAGQGA